MFVDASALVAILLNEPEREVLLNKIDAAFERATSPIAVYETVLALMRDSRIARPVAERDVRDLIKAANISMVPITDEMGRAALDAFDRYGKGRHRAGLNMGDCFAYGAARVLGVPLLYKGADFAATDAG